MQDMNRRAFLTRGSLVGVGALAAHSPTAALALPASRNFGAVDAALDQAVADGTALGVAAMAATPDGVIYNGTSGNRGLGRV